MADNNNDEPFGKHPGRADGTTYNPATKIDVTNPTFRRNPKTGKLVKIGPDPKTHDDEKVELGSKTGVELELTTKTGEYKPDELAASSKPSKQIMKEEAWVALFEAVLRRQKRKQKIIKLPVDLTKSGIHPDPNDKTGTERMEQAKEYLRLLDDLERGEKQTRANTIVRTMQQKHHRPRIAEHFPDALQRTQELVPVQSQQSQPFFIDRPKPVKQKRKRTKNPKEVAEAFGAGALSSSRLCRASCSDRRKPLARNLVCSKHAGVDRGAKARRQDKLAGHETQRFRE